MSGTSAAGSVARAALEGYDGPRVRIMEVCGTHTHEIFRQGIRRLLPAQVELISGPGCPVCVTPVGFIDEALFLALERGCTIATFGDLVRVPGSRLSLADARARGARVRVVWSPQDAQAYAAAHPKEEVVFLSVGFETTTPSCCLAVRQAKEQGVCNFSLLTANKTMPGAYEAMRGSTDLFLYPGHVHAVTGTAVCEDLARAGVSGVVAGFTARELVTALAVGVTRFAEGEPFFVNCYPRVVRPEGSPAARRIVDEMMEPCDARWRGIGTIEGSGLRLRERHAAWDARVKFDVAPSEGRENPACRCGEVLQGRCAPGACPVFGRACTPEHPVGACMVSSEGACSAYYLYGADVHRAARDLTAHAHAPEGDEEG
ncbi:hydrogenase formation protein HypD [Olsenella sp. HMSC062G07]|uniref:hydrogenase formation protein HypD n=1 Tax=Olsenella sp. HMSC062G07 TaxID=1739330 RepID=UPI000AF0E346|nr:hydrogenase formation protein HypD [Olsenella sp. HMSC062G07]